MGIEIPFCKGQAGANVGLEPNAGKFAPVTVTISGEMTATMTRPNTPEAFETLARAASLARRPGVVVLDQDLPALDDFTGSRAESHDLVARLERQGRLRRVRRGAYALADSTGTVRAGVLDLVGALTPEPYLVTGGRALQFHELSDQHFRRVHVLVPTQLRPWSWRGDEIRYVRTDKALKTGTTRTRRSRARIATPERAIADSLSHPQWGVTLAQNVEALAVMLTRDGTFPDRLARETVARDSHVLARRLGFLVSRLAGAEAARPFLPLRGASKTATLLLSGGPREGPIDPTWRVRENVEIQRLLRPAERE